jgi:hypothetical protein
MEIKKAPPIQLKDYMQALKEVKPSNSELQVKALEKWFKS